MTRTVGLLVVSAAVAFAPQRTRAQEKNSFLSFTCSFSHGVAASWEDDHWKKHAEVSESQPLMFRFRIYKADDLKKAAVQAKKSGKTDAVKRLSELLSTASAEGWVGVAAGAEGRFEPVLVTVGEDSITFGEVTRHGNVQTTSVFGSARSLDGRLAAIHSRHTAMGPLGVIPAQYLGACMPGD
jgi:hypothetical protein